MAAERMKLVLSLVQIAAGSVLFADDNKAPTRSVAIPFDEWIDLDRPAVATITIESGGEVPLKEPEPLTAFTPPYPTYPEGARSGGAYL